MAERASLTDARYLPQYKLVQARVGAQWIQLPLPDAVELTASLIVALTQAAERGHLEEPAHG